MAKGEQAEEALRAYFWNAGFFALRGVPVQVAGEDVTDLDIWLYDRPSGVARHTRFVDIKYKARPKAFERVLWSAGVGRTLGYDGCFVATTDSRPSLRGFAFEAGVELIDGNDLKRIVDFYSATGWSSRYLSDEELIAGLLNTDKMRDERTRTDLLKSSKSLCVVTPGAATLVRGLHLFEIIASLTAKEHSNSKDTEFSLRLSYLAASVATISLDSVLAQGYFKSTSEKKSIVSNAVRFGRDSHESGFDPYAVALALVDKYSPNQSAPIRKAVNSDLQKIPSEIISDSVLKINHERALFDIARELLDATYAKTLPRFSDLSVAARSLIGAYLDFSSISRTSFTSRWDPQSGSPAQQPLKEPTLPYPSENEEKTK